MPVWPGRMMRVWTDEVRVAARQASREELLRRLLLVGALEVVSFWVIAQITPGFDIVGWSALLYAVLVVAALNAVLRPAILWFMLPFTFLTFGLLTIVINAALLWLAAMLVEGVTVRGFGAALLGVLGLAAVNTVASSVFHVGDEQSFYRHLVARAARRREQRRRAARGGEQEAAAAEGTGLVIVQLDGLSAEALRAAVRGGHVPTITRWLHAGSHRVQEWECSVPSQTSTNQAGLLYGNDFDIPAFRWYEKERDHLVVSSRPADAAAIEARIRRLGPGLLEGGSSVGNLVSGDAARSVLTMSTLGDPGRTRSDDFFYYFLSPYAFSRSLVMMLREAGRELRQALGQRLRDERPRVSRGRASPLLRAVACVALRDMTLSMVIEDLHGGVPIVFCDFVGYDEVAHRTGPLHPDALRVLGELDEQLATLERVAAHAPRPYQFVLLSDHGQSAGTPFRQRHGETIGEVVERLAPGQRVRISLGTDEGWGTLNAWLSELLAVSGSWSARTTARIVRRLFRARLTGGHVEVGPDRASLPEPPAELVVCASGNLALIYLATQPGRLTAEQLDEHAPGLVSGLAAHPGVGFVMVRTLDGVPLVIGRDGRRRLDGADPADDRVEGADPLAPFGPYAAGHLRRLAAYPHSGDIVVNSAVDPFTGEVAAFEEFIGSHGGLGGQQTRAVLLHPAGWETPPELVGAPAVHAVLRRWQQALAAPPLPPADRAADPPRTDPPRAAPAGPQPAARPVAPRGAPPDAVPTRAPVPASGGDAEREAPPGWPT